MLKKLSLLTIGLSLALITLLLFSPKANAASFTTNTTADTTDTTPGNGTCADGSGNCSLRAALQEANSLAGADTINVSAGTYTLTSNLPTITQAADLTILGASSSTVTVDGGDNYSAFVFAVSGSIPTMTVKNMTIKRTKPDSVWECWAGPVCSLDVHLIAENLILDNNIGYGLKPAGLQSSNTYSITIKNVLVTNAQNWTGLGSPLAGGILLGVDGPLFNVDIQNISMANNSVGNFIGLLMIKNIVGTIQNITIANNSAPGDVIGYYADIGAQANLTMQNITIANNTGGGVSGIFGLSTGIAVISQYGGIINHKNTLLANNKLNSTAVNCSSYLDIVSLGGNLSDDNTCTTKFTQPTDKNSTNPLLGTLTSFDPYNYVLPLLSGSPAIDAGVSSGAPNVDQRGISRPQGSGIDIGAYEYQPTGSVESGESDNSSGLGTPASSVLGILPVTGPTIFIPFALALLTTFAYIVWDWRRHLKPLREQNPQVHYTLPHHIKVVTMPKVQYRLGLVHKRLPLEPISRR